MDKILIKNGMVYDPFLHMMEKRELAVAGSRIVSTEGFTPDIVIDAEGCLVTPGLIDFHLHCYESGSDGADAADLYCLPNGVTTCIDGGTAGSASYDGFYQDVVVRSTTRVMGLLHVAPEGLTTGRHGENQTPADWDIEKMEQLCQKYKDTVAGIKVRQSANLLDMYGLHDEPLVEAVKLAERLGKKVVVHVNDPNVTCGKIASELRPGDVFCHMYAGNNESILDVNGKIQTEVAEARQRGVIFDACNGRGNYLFSVCEKCLEQGFKPDIISSDMSPFGFYKQPLLTLPRLLSKYLALGLTLEEVLDCATINPARWIGRESLASLAEGTESDIAIFKLKEKTVRHFDKTGTYRDGHQVLVAQLTIRDGRIVYCQSDFL